MKNSKNRNLIYKSIKVIENATIFFKDGDKRIFDAIHKTDKGVFTGYIINYKIKNNNKFFLNNHFEKFIPNYYYLEFVDNGFIPDYNIKSIKGGSKKTAFKKKFLNNTNNKK
jgi:hypothetical protein